MYHSLLHFSYIDVGAGSMLLQASLASLFTVIVFARQLKKRCIKYFMRGKKNVQDNEQQH